MITKSTSLAKVLKLGEECKKCGHCCKHGTGFLVKDDIPKIAKFLGISEKKLKKKYLEPVTRFNATLFRPVTIKNDKPFGVCVFYDNDKSCTIHKVKPLHCKVGNCSEYGEELSVWFTLNYFFNEDDPQSIREWKIYLDSGGRNISGGKMEELVPNKQALKKILNYEVLR
jgi:Fe-S-cluster containining protein